MSSLGWFAIDGLTLPLVRIKFSGKRLVIDAEATGHPVALVIAPGSTYTVLGDDLDPVFTGALQRASEIKVEVGESMIIQVPVDVAADGQ